MKQKSDSTSSCRRRVNHHAACLLIVALVFCASVSSSDAQCNVNLTAAPAGAALDVNTINTILLRHNELRVKVTGAKNMPLLKWNQQIAALAQAYTSTCPGPKHSDISLRLGKAGFQHMGENLAWGMQNSAAWGWNTAIEMWGKEGEYWTYVPSCSTQAVCGTCVPQPPFISCGHYTQIVWANTTEIGCGYADCPNAPGRHYYTCWYGAGGNIRGMPPYQVGASTTADVKCSLSSLYSSGSGVVPTPPNPPPPVPGGNAPPPGGDDSGGGSGAVIGGVVGGIVVVAVIGAAVGFYIKKQKSSGIYVGTDNMPSKSTKGEGTRARTFTMGGDSNADFMRLEEKLMENEAVPKVTAVTMPAAASPGKAGRARAPTLQAPIPMTEMNAVKQVNPLGVK